MLFLFLLSWVVSISAYTPESWLEQKIETVSQILEVKISEKWETYRREILELLGTFERTYQGVQRAEYILQVLIRSLSWLPDQPNILLIIADDLGKDATPWFAPYETQKAHMPHLEQLMQDGLAFDNVRSSPVCTPTRGTILTWKFWSRTGVLQVDDPIPEDELSLHQHITNETGGEYASTIKWKRHLGGKRADPQQIQNMWIQEYVWILWWWVKSYDSWSLTKNGTTSTSTDYITTKITDETIDWIQQQDWAWFAWVAYTAPHTPFHLPPSHMHTRTDLSWTQEDIEEQPLEYFLAMAESLDYEIGRLLTEIDENTIVIFVGDNGTPWQVAQSPYEPRRVKWSLYQWWIDVPMLISGPWVIRKGEREDALVTLSDMFPTIADLLWIDSPDWIDWKSVASHVYDPLATSREWSYAEFQKESTWRRTTAWSSGQVARNNQFKLIRWTHGEEEMYDLIQDPYEENNLLKENLSVDHMNIYAELNEIIDGI